jgi:hypothetical protein
MEHGEQGEKPREPTDHVVENRQQFQMFIILRHGVCCSVHAQPPPRPPPESARCSFMFWFISLLRSDVEAQGGKPKPPDAGRQVWWSGSRGVNLSGEPIRYAFPSWNT